MKIYLRKIDEQCINKQISYTKEILKDFLDNKDDHQTILCEAKNTHKSENVALLLATDPRFDNSIKRILSSEGDYQAGDIMMMYKLKSKYVVELIKKVDSKYEPLINLFAENDRHLLINIDDVLYNDNSSNLLNFNVFGLHMTMQNSALTADQKHITIGWSYLGDISKIRTKEELKNLYVERTPKANNQRIGCNVGIIWRFIGEMLINDFVIYADGKQAHIGKVLSLPYYKTDYENQDPDYVNNRDVEWLKSIDYKKLPLNFKNSLGASMSVFSLNEYKSLILEILEGKYDNVEIEDCVKITGENEMFYGVPGCGKSYYIENELCSDIDDNHKERITFHPDYTYGDFVGQLLPQTDGNGKIKYEFAPGPFTKILAKAYENQDEQFVLIIEEINRGNAAAIFGDVFQLLDRQNGRSEYGITNEDIRKELENIGYADSKVYIPNNLSIYATLNTSDQNVFVLDTAFKRRWKEELIENNIEMCEYRHVEIVNSVTWEKFFNVINDKIAELVSLNICEEDKMLGAFFVKKVELNDPKAFAGKVLSYLWNDVLKYHRDSLFVTDKYKTFEQIRTAFIGDDGFNIFDKNKIEFIEEIKQEVAEAVVN